MIYLDTETCGLHGLPVLIQYAEDEGPITLYEAWRRPVAETLQLIEWMAAGTVCGFNLAFDWFHLCKLYTIWQLLPGDWVPAEHIEAIAEAEPLGRDGPCLKPAGCLDLLLVSRKGPYQALMAREDVRIRKVPTALAYELAEELEKRVELDGIYFARRKDHTAPQWQVFDRIDRRTGEMCDQFKDVVLKFHPAGGLKYLAEHALGFAPKAHFGDIEPASKPVELGYAPFAQAVSSAAEGWAVYDAGKLKGHAWPAIIAEHIEHWATHQAAREYATDDITYTRALHKHFAAEPNDTDSILACMVAAVRWHGFTVDLEKLAAIRRAAQELIDTAPLNVNAIAEVRAYLAEVMDETEQLLLTSTDKQTLEKIVNGELWRGHPAAARAQTVLELRKALKKRDVCDKLIRAGRFHASFNVIGALSHRMSGADGLNAQGIDRSKEFRAAFTLAWPGYELCGGDFDAYEVSLAHAVFGDPGLDHDLRQGLKIHAVFGEGLYPGKTYADIRASEGSDFDMYTRSKSGFFAYLYGGTEYTLIHNLSIDPDAAREAGAKFEARYQQVGTERNKTFKDFAALSQPDGGAIYWRDPAGYVETKLGFRRYFTLENKIIRALYELAQRPPKHWRQIKLSVVRSNRVQTAHGAVASALYGAAFALQGANGRAANNHKIQSLGATITKDVQAAVWELQPAGVHPWVIAPLNVHDEIMAVTHPSYVDRVVEVVRAKVESFRPLVPLIGLSWNRSQLNWAEKKAGSDPIKIAA